MGGMQRARLCQQLVPKVQKLGHHSPVSLSFWLFSAIRVLIRPKPRKSNKDTDNMKCAVVPGNTHQGWEYI